MMMLVAWKKITIEGGNPVTANVEVHNTPCEIGAASVDITISGGTPLFRIMDCDQQTGGDYTSERSYTIEGLSDGHYCKKIIDADGCETIIEF